ncbi:MAG: hypothetical protein U5O69_04735 [Candidatus Competibacteraceae bacterium]|nr:hypothetical protein [Candidatus Competibacteraceae bacterium]
MRQRLGDVDAHAAVERVLMRPFVTSDSVEVVPDIFGSVLVQDGPDGSVIGTQEAGTRGTVLLGGSRYSSKMGVWMWNVDFDTGVDGWVAEQVCVK